MLQNLLNDLEQLSNPDKAKILSWFFKTWVWQYWEWDIFLWINIPTLKTIAKKYRDLSFIDIETLFASKIHDYRYLALNIIKINYEKEKDEIRKKDLFELSLKNISSINNWDLVDTFIPYVWWEYFFAKDRSFLYELAISSNLWKKRISILTTFYFLKQWDFFDTIKISEILLQDKHDLIHKATGWMLREIWKRDIKTLYEFLNKYSHIMPRTMLRYAIEKLNKEQREFYMKKDY